jgi:uncharacterized protein (DUF983 family)
MIKHNCPTCGQALLLKALEAVVPTLCPACGPIYALAKNVSKVETGPSNITGIAGAICSVLLLFAGAKIIDDLFS